MKTKETTQTRNPQEQRMREIDERARRDKRRWLLIMLLIMAAILALSVGVSVAGGLQYAPYAMIFAIITLAITAKLCVAQMGKIMERQRSEREKLDSDGTFARFHLDS